MNKKSGFTLLELLIVVIVLSIVAILATPQYAKAVERTKAKEAISILKLVVTAERDYQIQNNNYFPLSGTIANLSEISYALGLNIPNENNWDYDVTVGGPGASETFIAAARRKGDGPYSSCSYSITLSEYSETSIPEPVASGNCP